MRHSRTFIQLLTKIVPPVQPQVFSVNILFQACPKQQNIKVGVPCKGSCAIAGMTCKGSCTSAVNWNGKGEGGLHGACLIRNVDSSTWNMFPRLQYMKKLTSGSLLFKANSTVKKKVIHCNILMIVLRCSQERIMLHSSFSEQPKQTTYHWSEWANC